MKLDLTENAKIVLQRRYLKRNEKGKIIETPLGMFKRVARVISKPDSKFKKDPKKSEKKFFDLMTNLRFLPNSPTLMNAGTRLGQLSACFVLPVEDSIKSIFTAVLEMAQIHQSGGGTGYTFTHLRPKNDIVRSTGGKASGPVSFMKVFDVATEVVKQGGRRRGANMGILNVNHPDIIEFIIAKLDGKTLSNFNISVGVTDKFMRAVKKGEDYYLINPRNRKRVGKLNAKKVFDLICATAWKIGDPGMIFLDTINRKNPTPKVGKIESTNPCGEVPLLPYESCNLGSINLSKFVQDGNVLWEELAESVKDGIHFLDNVIEANKFPLPEIEKMTKGNRKVGLGVMGFAEMLIQLGIPYNSEKGVRFAENLMKFISKNAREKSIELGEERGNFPNFELSIWAKKYQNMRNATVTTIAPTGSISIIAGCSSGIEPLFAVVFERHILSGKRLIEINKYFEEIAKREGFYSKNLMKKVLKQGNLVGIKEVPEEVKKIFVTALEVSPKYHVKMQAAFQKYVDNAVSKTVNLPQSASVEDIKNVYFLAHKLKCKGITVYRYGSKEKQVLKIGAKKVEAHAEYAGGCPSRVCVH